MRLITPHLILIALILGVSIRIGAVTNSVLGASISALFALIPFWIACVRLIEYNRLSKRFRSFLHGRVIQASFKQTTTYVLRRMIGPTQLMLDMQNLSHSRGHRRVFAHVFADLHPDVFSWKQRVNEGYGRWDKNVFFKMRKLSWKDFFIPQF